MEAVIRYLMSNMDTQATDTFKKLVEAISFEGAKTVMTIAEFLIEKGKIEDAKKMKDRELEINFIHEITGLTKEQIEKR